MKTAIVLFAPGFEESEALTVTDVLRRGGVDARTVGTTPGLITGAHGISILPDGVVGESGELPDLVVLPGGYDGVDALAHSADVLTLLRRTDGEGRMIGAICAAPLALEAAGLLSDHRFTAYPGVEARIASGEYRPEPIVRDGNLITACGPAFSYAFGYALLDALGLDSEAVKRRMVYANSFDEATMRYSAPECTEAAAAPRNQRIAVLMAEGFEEGETFTIVDILRRLGFSCDALYFDAPLVKGMHGMMLRGDRPFGEDVIDYDLVILPGGRPGGDNLRGNPRVLEALRAMNAMPGKTLAAMCSGTTVLAAAGVIEGKRMTGYTGYAAKLPGAIFVDEVAVADQNLVTSQGPATPFPFAFRIAERFGADTGCVRARMLYAQAGGRG